MDLDALQRIKQWHVAHQQDHPVEYHAWDAMLTFWLVGWVGWIPAFAFEALWGAPGLVLRMASPSLYVTWRRRAHQAKRLRCDWIGVR